MKKIFLSFTLISSIVACKKVTTSPTTNGDTINSTTVNINFTAKGTPVGSFENTITDVDGNIYKTVIIGKQQWMAENLKTTKYSNGTIIPNETDSSQWSNLTTGAWSYYNNDSSNNTKYGKLYNWYAISPITNGNKNVCPWGWHVPSDADWTVLTDYLGGEGIAGGKMKEVDTTNWTYPNIDATNISLFTALPGGFRGSGSFSSIGYGGIWWSSTEAGINNAWHRGLSRGNGMLVRDQFNYKGFGFSIRCVKD
jgi:uncharacterized protein (TIGR02145 family)